MCAVSFQQSLCAQTPAGPCAPSSRGRALLSPRRPSRAGGTGASASREQPVPSGCVSLRRRGCVVHLAFNQLSVRTLGPAGGDGAAQRSPAQAAERPGAAHEQPVPPSSSGPAASVPWGWHRRLFAVRRTRSHSTLIVERRFPGRTPRAGRPAAAGAPAGPAPQLPRCRSSRRPAAPLWSLLPSAQGHCSEWPLCPSQE